MLREVEPQSQAGAGAPVPPRPPDAFTHSLSAGRGGSFVPSLPRSQGPAGEPLAGPAPSYRQQGQGGCRGRVWKLPAPGPEPLVCGAEGGPGSRGCPVREGGWFTRRSGEGLQGWGMGVCVTLSRPSSSARIHTVALSRAAGRRREGSGAESWGVGSVGRPGAPDVRAAAGCVALPASAAGGRSHAGNLNLQTHNFTQAMLSQPKMESLDNPTAYRVGLALLGVGSTFVLSSFFALGFTGTFLGDYFGILKEARVTTFPFNVLDNPMYWGSTANYLGWAVMHASPTGLLLTAVVALVYMVAILYEEPFTAQIYQQKASPSHKRS
ncbi:phosphatidylethanolamine N-methyltransferase isoform X2 [Meles meles]|uniref:phosphatidylethanolamine N-methyltransferase isoform X2 n=1 Tax=Meles meles TaxID=9662 RepID=UPI001E69E160|nr:phosphatidylethanolamine N-methyltransferase isoform X2 [Meles meles]